jgi:hypothetical protein
MAADRKKIDERLKLKQEMVRANNNTTQEYNKKLISLKQQENQQQLMNKLG